MDNNKPNKEKADKIAEMRQTANWWMAVINAPQEKSTLDEKRAFLSILTDTIKSYTEYPFSASIIHDKDIEINGELKTIHLHAFIDTPSKPTKRQLLSELSNLLNIDKDLISLTPTNNNYLLVQYLTHKNDKLKTQYDKSLIITNNEEELSKRYKKTYRKPLDEDELQEEIFVSSTFTDLIKKVGLENAKKYQNCFKQVKQEQEQDLNGLLNKIHRLEAHLEHIARMLNIFFNACDIVLDDNEKEYLKIDTLKREINDSEANFIDV